jgi:magnesium-transporting ATPase (P-type)
MAEEQSTQRLPPKTTNIKVERSIFWKIYFFIFVGLTSLEFIFVGLTSLEFIFESIETTIWDIVNIPIMIMATIGLYGYVFSKNFYKQYFWLCFFVFLIIWDAMYSIVVGMPPDPELTEMENKYIDLFAIILTYILMTPAYIGLLLYGLPSNKLWKVDSFE